MPEPDIACSTTVVADETGLDQEDADLAPYADIAAMEIGWISRLFSPMPKPTAGLKKPLWMAIWIVGVPIWAFVCACVYWFGSAMSGMPDTSVLWVDNREPLIVIEDRFGREITRIGGAGAERVKLEDVPMSLTDALVAVEDRRFIHHPGFDVIGLARAMRENLKAGRVVQGGSTLTQQLAKNVFLTREQTLKRKTQELMLAVKLESRYSKREIMELYLSRVYFGGGTLGVNSGVKRFFDKPVLDLEVGESALLAGILQAPDRLNPLKNKRLSAERTAHVLGEMKAQSFLSEAQYQYALAHPIAVEVLPAVRDVDAGYVTDWIMDDIDERIGPARGDIVIRTTLDIDAQKTAEQAVKTGINPERNATQAALIAFDGVGGVRAMVGGADYRHSTYNRAVRSLRQPGSAFKPFVFLAAMERGYRPGDIFVDEPIDIEGWRPGNFTNTFKGEMNLETALALSINTIAVKLHYAIGPQTTTALAQRVGLNGLKPYHSLALGAQEITLLDLTAAYIPFANWGYVTQPYIIESVYGANGNVLYEYQPSPRERVLESKVLAPFNRMMKTTMERGTGKGARIIDYDLAGKTGTTNDYRDAWFIGYGTDIVAGVWVGNDDNSKMARVTGGTIPAKIWQNFMKKTLADNPPAPLFSAPPTAVKAMQEDRLSALLDNLEDGLN